MINKNATHFVLNAIASVQSGLKIIFEEDMAFCN